MTTAQIKSTTSPHLLYEQQVKSLCEPVMISILREANLVLGRTNPTWHLISRGGDALNYYYKQGEFIPTHDWDLGLVSLPANNNITQDIFNDLKVFIDTLGQTIATRLTDLFRTHIRVPFQDLVFTYTQSHARLSGINFNYRASSGEKRTNSVADLYIWGNVSPWVDWRSSPNSIPILVDNVRHFDEKYDYTMMQKLKKDLERKNTDLVGYLRNELLNDRQTLYKNTFNYIIEDLTSGMKYVAPGDLLTDTMRMIYQSLYNIRIAQGNNKVDKYIVKYSRLLDVINDMSSLCSGRGCAEITAKVISRDTNNLDCSGRSIQNRDPWLQSRMGELAQWYNQSYLTNNHPVWNLVPSKKLCEMIQVLKPDDDYDDYDDL